MNEEDYYFKIEKVQYTRRNPYFLNVSKEKEH